MCRKPISVHPGLATSVHSEGACHTGTNPKADGYPTQAQLTFAHLRRRIPQHDMCKKTIQLQTMYHKTT